VAGNVTHWYQSICLACARSWVPSPALQNKNWWFICVMCLTLSQVELADGKVMKNVGLIQIIFQECMYAFEEKNSKKLILKSNFVTF
jgi:hypothetical protein